jgi:hypothetical protein
MERQVGSSGQSVAPKVYFAFAFSGVIQHLVAISRSTSSLPPCTFNYAQCGLRPCLIVQAGPHDTWVCGDVPAICRPSPIAAFERLAQRARNSRKY